MNTVFIIILKLSFQKQKTKKPQNPKHIYKIQQQKINPLEKIFNVGHSIISNKKVYNQKHIYS